MKSKHGGWWLVALVVLLIGAVSLAEAGGEEEKKAETKTFYAFGFDGRARLGVQVSDVNAEKARDLKLGEESGALIEEVEEDSPAAKAGLQANDVILSFAGERVRSVQQLRRLVRETPPGRSVAVEVSREGQRRTLQVTLEEHPAEFEVKVPDIHVPAIEVPRLELPEIGTWVMSHGPRLGISGDELTPQLAEYFGVEQGKGVLVREVMAGSAADKGGLKAGDVIVAVEDEPVATIGELRRALRRKGENPEVTLTFVRNRRAQTLKVTLEEPQSRSPRQIAALEIQVDPEAHKEWAAEMKAAAEEWKHELEAWREDFEQELHLQKEEWRHHPEPEDLQEELRPLQEETRVL
ncbi:MAG TPA: PDZ domain-containing protein [Candidatus Acidoferrales bacterium]|nr:PDZ domain-containing protein [Candidatus Acidoferrales bacterium]